VVAIGVVIIAAGQALNVSVFRRLGKVGVFYGNRFGYTVSWCFPAPDWIVVPFLETVYYAAGARLEQDPITPTTLKRRWRSS
jgi:methylene-fatty-acyl-phospholipid synthase